jgi:hypothetical protein
VTVHEGDAWRGGALAVVCEVARERPELTIEDVSPRVGATLDPRALGRGMVEAKRRGWVSAAGYVNLGSERHGKPICLWRSSLWRPL